MLKEHTEKLARLMAGENIDVEQKPSQTAYFDLKSRKLVIPNWKNLSAMEEEMLVGHEIGHALYTNESMWTSAIESFDGNKAVFKNVVNIVEDARIERFVKTKYPGMRKIFYYGYEELFNRGIFQLDELNTEQMTVLDQLNFHYKIPGKVAFDRTPEFEEFVRKIDSVQSFDDVLSISKELYRYCRDVDSKKEQGEEGEEGNESESSDSLSNRSQSSDSTGNEQSSSGKRNSSPEEGQEFEDRYGKSTMEDKKNDFLSQNLDANEYQTHTLPEVKLEDVVIPFTKVLESIDHNYRKPIKEDDLPEEFTVPTSLAKFNRERKSTVEYYSKIFEMKKKAAEYRKTLNFRTGKLDMSRIHNYKFDDNLFLSGQIKFKGKNHGLVIFLDMSGSMQRVFKQCLIQLLELVSFSRNSGIALYVYGFSDSQGQTLSLVELFSPDMSTKQFNKMFEFIASGRTESRSHYFYLGGTPLGMACLCLEEVVNKLRKGNGCEIVNAIFITDGGDTSCSYLYSRNGFLTDPKTKMKVSYAKVDAAADKSWCFYGGCSYSPTMAILELMKKRVSGVNVVNFFIRSTSRWDNVKGYCKDAYVLSDPIKYVGYDQNYLVDPETFQTSNPHDKIMKIAISSSVVHDSFVKSKKVNMEKQTMIRQFIDKIC